jgi:hypothetical protein
MSSHTLVPARYSLNPGRPDPLLVNGAIEGDHALGLALTRLKRVVRDEQSIIIPPCRLAAMSRWNASSRSRESPGNLSASVAATFSGNLSAPSDLGIVLPTYTFATPVFGGQATVGVLGSYGVVSTSLAGTLAARSACFGSAASRSRGSTASAIRCGASAT